MWPYIVAGIIVLLFMGTVDIYLEKISKLLVEIRDLLKQGK